MWLRNKWESLPAGWKIEIQSVVHTFIAAAVAEWAFTGFGVPSSRDAIYALLLTMLRAGIKAVGILLVPVKKEV